MSCFKLELNAFDYLSLEVAVVTPENLEFDDVSLIPATSGLKADPLESSNLRSTQQILTFVDFSNFCRRQIRCC